MAKVLILANHFITIHSFRKELVQELVNLGHDVFLSLPKDSDNIWFENLGCKIIETKIERRGFNPIKDFCLLLNYYKMMNYVHPDIVFSYTIKPNIYGSIASNFLHIKQVCNITGTGATFLKRNLISHICEFLYKISVRKCYKVFFQNTGDRDYFIEHNMVNDNFAMLPGSGCNLSQHKFVPLPNTSHLNFIYIGRVMQLKGIDEYLECAKQIHLLFPKTSFYIAGWNEEPDYMRKVEEAQKAGYVEYLGFRKDIDHWIEKCHCTILASHGGEGVPNVLLESAATGRICIASEINGSKDVIEDGVTGFLFEKGNAEDLIEKVKLFIKLPYDEKMKMSAASRKKVEKEFDRNIVVNAYIEEVEKCNK